MIGSDNSTSTYILELFLDEENELITQINETKLSDRSHSTTFDVPLPITELLIPVHLDFQSFSEQYLGRSSQIPCIIEILLHSWRGYFLLTSSLSSNSGKSVLYCSKIQDVGTYQVLKHSYIQLEEIIQSITSLMLNSNKSTINGNITTSLGKIGSHFDADRCYLFLINHETSSFSNTHEWVYPGVSSYISEFQNIPFDDFPWVIDEILDNRIINYEDISDIPDDGIFFYEELDRENVKSITLVPIREGSQVIGFTGIEGVRHHQKFDDHTVFFLQAIGEIFITALGKLDLYLEAERNETFYRLLFESTDDSVVFTNPSGDILDYNQAFVNLFGYSREELKGMKILEFYWDDSDREDVIELISSNEISHIELHLRTKYNDRILVDITISTQNDLQDNQYYFSIIRDITFKRKEQQRLAHNQKLAAISQMAGQIAHDVNNSLMKVMGFLELMSLKDESDREFYVEKINQSIDEAKEIAQNLIYLSGNSYSAQRLGNFNNLIDEMREELQTLTDSITLIEYALQKDVSDLVFNRSQIRRLITNLVLNAYQAYVDINESRKWIGIKTRELIMDRHNFNLNNFDHYLISENFLNGLYASITIQDKGIGISSEFLAEVFNPYFSTKAEGNGLGLNSVMEIINRHNGAMAISSVKNQGTTITVFIPVKNDVDN